MQFRREEASSWRDDVPGARWFKADLHIHTIDDLPGGRAKVPAELSVSPRSESGIKRYARLFLQRLVAQGVTVAGLTPHSPKLDETPDSSVVWAIVNAWNAATDADGVPFRDKIYAVFPGFEPSLSDGSTGLHLLFLFDPEIGRERYLRAFDLVMGGVSPWRDKSLKISNRSARKAFSSLREFKAREQSGYETSEWDYAVVARHVNSPKGLLRAQKSQILELFEHKEVCAFELGDNQQPKRQIDARPWLLAGMQKHRQAFIHSSDAYSLDEIGVRFTWVKLACPRIEALRQAFVASDSRLRIPPNWDTKCATDPAVDPSLHRHPWLKQAVIRNRASFFSAPRNAAEETRFQFSPDLTCVIGGSMTGKSTLLDGLRTHCGASPPTDPTISRHVSDRGHSRFGARSPDIDLDIQGGLPAAPVDERWPAQFFSQNELQALSQNAIAINGILGSLVPKEAEIIEKIEVEMSDLDDELGGLATRVDKLEKDLAVAEQACRKAAQATESLAQYSAAGVEDLHQAAKYLRRWTDTNQSAHSIRAALTETRDDLRGLDIPRPASNGSEELAEQDAISTESSVALLRARVVKRLDSIEREILEWLDLIDEVIRSLSAHQENLRATVEQRLAESGLTAASIMVTRELGKQASLLANYSAVLKQTRRAATEHGNRFLRLLERRSALVNDHREAFRRVTAGIEGRFAGIIRVRRVDHGMSELLERFLTGLRSRGVTRWWNLLAVDERPSPEKLVQCLVDGCLDRVGMTATVQESFRDALTKSKRRELKTIRCPDRYVVELQMDSGNYRSLDELSGGQRVGVLLSLLLQTVDDRPLVIDQPEDELDNRFLSDTILPALKRLKGRRQVIVATHNANIVVNGDADMVIELEATADRGWVSTSGTIEDPAVRNAIVRTVDGGADAFRLRQRKYGF